MLRAFPRPLFTRYRGPDSRNSKWHHPACVHLWVDQLTRDAEGGLRLREAGAEVGAGRRSAREENLQEGGACSGEDRPAGSSSLQ